MKKLSFICVVIVMLLNCGLLFAEEVTITKEMVSDDKTNNRYYPAMSQLILETKSDSDIKYVIRQIASLNDYELYELLEATNSQGESYAVKQKIKECFESSTGLKSEGVMMDNYNSNQFNTGMSISIAEGDLDLADEIRNSFTSIEYVKDSEIPSYYWHFINGLQLGLKNNGINTEVILFTYEIGGRCNFLIFVIIYS